ncbi:MAG: tetratricopeptide repeat protein [Alphaproteobacteria bacterium]
MASTARSLAVRAGEAIAAADWQRAESLLRRLVRTPDAPAQAAYNLALVLIERAKVAQAGAWFAKAVKRDPDYAAAWFEYGRWYLARGDPAKARDAFAATARLEPGAEDARRNLARIAERMGDFEASLAAWRVVERLAGADDGEAALGTLRALLELRRPEAAALKARLWESPATRPSLLKVLTRTSAGSLSLDPERLGG